MEINKQNNSSYFNVGWCCSGGCLTLWWLKCGRWFLRCFRWFELLISTVRELVLFLFLTDDLFGECLPLAPLAATNMAPKPLLLLGRTLVGDDDLLVLEVSRGATDPEGKPCGDSQGLLPTLPSAPLQVEKLGIASWWVGEDVQDLLVYGCSMTRRCIPIRGLPPSLLPLSLPREPMTTGCRGVVGVGHRFSELVPVRLRNGIL